MSILAVVGLGVLSLGVRPATAATTATTEVPRKIWTYWDINPPESVKRVVGNNMKLMTGWEYTFLTADTLHTVLDLSTFPPEYEDLRPQHKADYIRLRLLAEYGGIWMDSSIQIHDPVAIESMWREANARHLELVAFTLDNTPLYIENWFILAPKGSSVVAAWMDEFEMAVRQGFMHYKRRLFLEGGVQILPRIYRQGQEDVYLTQHACLQKVIQKRLPGSLARIQLYPAEETMFRLHTECNWKRDCIRQRLFMDPAVRDIPFVKLRGGER